MGEKRIVSHIQGLAQGRVAALENALLASDEKACQDILSINLRLSGLGQSLEALDSKVNTTFRVLEFKTNDSLAILEKKLEETACNLREAADRAKQPDDAGP